MEGDEYRRGVQDQRLTGHDEYLERIYNVQESAARDLIFLKTEFVGLRLDLQRLTDAVQADQKTVVTTASAVEAERKSTAEAVKIQQDTVRDTTDKRWSPLTRTAAVFSILVGLTILVTWLLGFHK